MSQLKQQPGQDILIAGSGALIQTLRRHDLIDEYRLLVYPVVLGSGKRLFRDVSDMTALKLVESKPSAQASSPSPTRRRKRAPRDEERDT